MKKRDKEVLKDKLIKLMGIKINKITVWDYQQIRSLQMIGEENNRCMPKFQLNKCK